MTDQRHPAARRDDQGDPWIERLLTDGAAADAYVEDGGFTERVLAQLPPHEVRSPTRLIVPLMSVVAFLVGLGLLSGGEHLSTQLTDLVSFDSVSIRALVTVMLPLALLYGLAVGAAIQQE
jgi:hypothetical protein